MHTVKISSKRQIAIPKSMMELLGVEVYDQVRIEADEASIKVTPVRKSVVEETAGSLYHLIPKSKRGIPFSKIREETQRIVASELASK